MTLQRYGNAATKNVVVADDADPIVATLTAQGYVLMGSKDNILCLGLPLNTPTRVDGTDGSDYTTVATHLTGGDTVVTTITPGGPTDLKNQGIANTATILGKLTTDLTQLESWITANPSGAVLTAAQTLLVMKGLDGLVRVVAGLVSTAGLA